MLLTAVATNAFNNGSGFEKGGNLNMSKNKITGDPTTGIYFDPDRDGTTEVTFNPDGSITSTGSGGTTFSSMTITGNLIVGGTGSFTGALTGATLDTGQGANELYDMNQNVQTTDAVTFATVDTGQGANELYDMNQNVQTTDTVQFGVVNINTGTISGTSKLTLNGGQTIMTGNVLRMYDSSNSRGLTFQYTAAPEFIIKNESGGKWTRFTEATNINVLGIWGSGQNSGVVISTYIAGATPPAKGLWVQGNVGIGAANFGATTTNLEVVGTGSFTDALSAATMNTGQGDYELYAMNQNVQTTSNVTFQNVTGTNGLNTTYGVSATTGVFSGAISATTLNTGQGAYELYAMNQNVQTTSNVQFNVITSSAVKAATSNGLFLVDDANLGMYVADGGNVGVGTTVTTYKFNVAGQINSSMIGTDGIVSATNASDATKIYMNTNGASYITGGNLGIGTATPSEKLEVYNGNIKTNYGINAATATYSGAVTVGSLSALTGAIKGAGYSVHITTIQTSAYTVTANDDIVISSGTLAINLPTLASSYDSTNKIGKSFTFKNAGIGTVTVTPNGAEKIDGAANYPLDTQYESIDVIAGETSWWVK